MFTIAMTGAAGWLQDVIPSRASIEAKIRDFKLRVSPKPDVGQGLLLADQRLHPSFPSPGILPTIILTRKPE
jgi:hypothetical protein